MRERRDRTELGYRRFRWRTGKREFNERPGTLFNHRQDPTEGVCLVVLWRVRDKLSLRELPELVLERGLIFTHEAVRDWEAQLVPLLSETLRKPRRGRIGCSWSVDETFTKVKGRLAYLDGHDADPGAITAELGAAVRHGTTRDLNNPLEQAHRGIKQRIRTMTGFERVTSATRFCRVHDEVRNFLRPRSYRNEGVSLAHRRVLYTARPRVLLTSLAATSRRRRKATAHFTTCWGES